jgi:tryptophanyl-tRNA synthetase
VPVGNDQKQHLELSRTLAKRINSLIKTRPGEEDFFPLIEEYSEEGFISYPRVMSLAHTNKKMSKSDTSSRSCLFLTGLSNQFNKCLDSDEEIRNKIIKATTDSLGQVLIYSF